MPRIDTGRSHHRATPRLGTPAAFWIGAATFAVASGTAQAAVPGVGAWESGSRSAPRVAFDVQGPARSRTVLRVSFPLTCKGSASPIGWGSTDLVRVHRDGTFTAYDFGSVIRGRFTATDRAAVTVRASDGSECRDMRRYVVIRRGRRIAVRTGRFLSLVGGGAVVGLEASAFGRMVHVEFMEGSLPAACTDGSQRSLPLAGPDEYLLAAPIRPTGRFDISAAAGSSITIAGTFDGGSVAAFVHLSVVLPGGVRCTARAQPLVGSLAFPFASDGEGQILPSAPEILPETPGLE